MRFLFSPPDIVHVQYLPMLQSRLPLDLWFVQFCRKRGSKIVLTVHDLLPHDTGEAHKQTFRDLYRMVDGIICHSDNIRSRLQAEFAVPEEKIAVIPHGPFFYDLPASASDQTLQSFNLEPGNYWCCGRESSFRTRESISCSTPGKHVEANNDDARLSNRGHRIARAVGSDSRTDQHGWD